MSTGTLPLLQLYEIPAEKKNAEYHPLLAEEAILLLLYVGCSCMNRSVAPHHQSRENHELLVDLRSILDSSRRRGHRHFHRQ